MNTQLNTDNVIQIDTGISQQKYDKLDFINSIKIMSNPQHDAWKILSSIDDMFSQNEQREIKNELINQKILTKKTIIKIENIQKFQNETGLKYKTNEYDFIASYFEIKKYKILPNGRIKNYSSEYQKLYEKYTNETDGNFKKSLENELQLFQITLPEFLTITDISNDLKKIIIQYKHILEFSVPLIETSLSSFLYENTTKSRNEFNIGFIMEIDGSSPRDRATDSEWDDLLNYIMPDDETPNDIKRAVIKQWMWNVQFVAHNKSNLSHPLMPIFYGQQGSGKSRFVNWLLSPISYMCDETTFSQYLDDKNIDIKTNNLVLNIPEMSGHTKTEFEKIKSNMDSGYISSRILYSHSSQTVYHRAQLIGTSNIHITNVIRDETGNRRFFQFLLGRDQSYKIDYSRFDAQRFWNSIKFSDEQPFNDTDLHDQIMNIQSTQRRLDIYEQWFNDHVIGDDVYTSSETSQSYQNMFEHLKHYADKNMSNPFYDFQTFKNRFGEIVKSKNMTLQNKVTKNNKKPVRYYWVER